MFKDYFLTILLLIVLVSSIIYKAKYHTDGNPCFFDVNNTKAMRGFWSIVVILVHIPLFYQNKIQDAIGSFAYIGVTFFFLTSAYGLTLKLQKLQGSARFLGRTRLPKIIVPQLITNIFFVVLFSLCFGDAISIPSLFSINEWIKWLLVCYFFLWFCNWLFPNNKLRFIVSNVAIGTFSLTVYFLRKAEIITTATWAPEVWGFIWGSLLALNLKHLRSYCNKKWVVKCLVACAISLVLGLSYLKLKPIAFWGDYLLKILLGIAITLFIVILNQKISIGNKLSLFLGEISYEIYLTHGCVFSFVSEMWGQFSSGEFILVSVLITIIFSYIIHFVSSKALKLVYDLLFSK